MSMTKKQAHKFKAALDAGEMPPLPDSCKGVLRMQPIQIVEDIRHARAFCCGTGPLLSARRLVQMGLFDNRFNLTNYGDSYVNALENVKLAHK
jgi:hypothetical protein